MLGYIISAQGKDLKYFVFILSRKSSTINVIEVVL
jgi:hypothetical protein